MFKISSIPSTYYSEVGQTNPIRWSVLKPTDNGYVGQHSWWKCKDFLNDTVIFRRLGKVFSIYGFDNRLTEEQIYYVALKGIDIPSFEQNLSLLNTVLEERELPKITFSSEVSPGNTGTQAVIGIDSSYFDNTFFISVITSLIRACAFNKNQKTLDDLIKAEETLSGTYGANVKKFFHRKNKAFCDSLIFSNYQYNGKKLPTASHTYHNAGLQCWIDSDVLKEA